MILRIILADRVRRGKKESKMEEERCWYKCLLVSINFRNFKYFLHTHTHQYSVFYVQISNRVKLWSLCSLSYSLAHTHSLEWFITQFRYHFLYVCVTFKILLLFKLESNLDVCHLNIVAYCYKTSYFTMDAKMELSSSTFLHVFLL